MKKMVKGENIAIDDISKKVTVTIKWKTYTNMDVDVSIFMLQLLYGNKITDNNDFIYFNNTKNSSIELVNKNNSSDIIMDLSLIEKSIDKLPIVITIDKKSSFSSLEFLDIKEGIIGNLKFKLMVLMMD